ncbi:MAG: hypothetical protein VKO64_12460 [Candidatus Sericytochromatia bacterium]|nr:hypothetical protein [Candidatus Sericytochromatia bacterium]
MTPDVVAPPHLPSAVAGRLRTRIARLERDRHEAHAEIARLREALVAAERGREALQCRLAEREEHLERTVLLQAFRSPEPRRALWPFSLAAR